VVEKLGTATAAPSEILDLLAANARA
jgi:hypothetical protein